MKPVVAFTAGDYNGIGPEVVLKALADPQVRAACQPLLIGAPEVFSWYARRYHLRVNFQEISQSEGRLVLPQMGGAFPVLSPAGISTQRVHPGKQEAAAGRHALAAIAAAVALTRTGSVDAIVTAPVSKKALHLAGARFPGQTELLQQLTHSREVAMMLVSPVLRVGLVTIHVPLARVARLISRALVAKRCTTIHHSLIRDYGIRRPRLAVLGLNPHAGEEGDMGKEERRYITPAIRSLRAAGISAAGPFPADGFFARYITGSYDAVIAMYHDQGLIPLKMTAEGAGVNYSAGLPIVRTSPDHGTAFDIAGKGIARPESTIAAALLATRIVRQRARAHT
jgi:4-phospho-D-threonate 3-dehydrogenase / 4-phospho-D-erythronate 3-dehydrogenase